MPTCQIEEVQTRPGLKTPAPLEKKLSSQFQHRPLLVFSSGFAELKLNIFIDRLAICPPLVGDLQIIRAVAC